MEFSVGFRLAVRDYLYFLEEKSEGILCTSDSVIIERAGIQIFDLARHCLEHHFQPDFTDLRLIIAQ